MPSTVREIFDRQYQSAGIERNTIATHWTMIRRWERLTANPRAREVTTATFEAYRAVCLEAGLSNDSIESGIITVSMVLRLAARVGILERAPWPGRRLRRRRTPKYVPPLADFGKLYAQAGVAQWPRGLDTERFWQALLCVGYFTGLRLSDLFFRMTWDLITPDGIFFVAHKTEKCHAFPRHPVVDRHLKLVENWHASRVFPVGRSVKQIRRELHRMSAAAGLAKPITMQPIRRLSATQWSAAKWGAGELIQGSAIKGTAMVYIVPQLLQQAGPLLAWPAELLLPEERDERHRQETQIVETFKRLGPVERQTVLALADRLSS